jgi:hypothetical protein
MTQLNQRNQSTASAISAVNEQLAQMQQMMLNLQSEVRQLSQQHKAQESLTKEWNSTQKTIEKQFKDACSVYGSPDAIDDMISDIVEVAEKVKENFDEYSVSDRFLNQETAEIEDESITDNVIPMIAESAILPSKDDNTTILTSKQIEQILSPLSEETLKQLKGMFNISNKITRLNSTAIAMAKHGLTHSKLSRLINNIEGQQLLLSSV